MITEADVAALGLYPHLPRHLEEFPPELHEHCGRGIGVWQYPNQFAKYLNAMTAENIRTYVEVGVAAGGTFMTTVDILKPSRRSVAIDIAPIGKSLDDAYRATPYDGQLEAFIAADPEKRSYFRGTAREFAESNACPETIDLLLIDGDHSYEGVKADFEALGPRSRIVVFHDIASDACPGVVRFWREIVDRYGPERTETFVDQYASVVKGSFLGIGVLYCKKNPLMYK
jgi:hypothetical protein